MEVNKSDINKTGDLTPPIPNNVEFGAKWVQMSPFGVTTLLGVVGGGGGERVKGWTLCNNYLEGFSHRFPSS